MQCRVLLLLPLPPLHWPKPNVDPHAASRKKWSWGVATTSKKRKGNPSGKANKYLSAEPTKVSTEGAERSSRCGAGRKHPPLQFPIFLAVACCSLVSVLPLSAGEEERSQGRTRQRSGGQVNSNKGVKINNMEPHHSSNIFIYMKGGKNCQRTTTFPLWR